VGEDGSEWRKRSAFVTLQANSAFPRILGGARGSGRCECWYFVVLRH
jgi:hypothetical protein